MNVINKVVIKLTNDFARYPDKYLTENDVRCTLVSRLMHIPEFNRLQDTGDGDGSKSVPIHTEVRWYGESGKLKWRSDVVFIDVGTLKVKNILFKLPSKGYSFNKPLAIIEIKLRRINGYGDSVFVKYIQQDINKLEAIKGEIAGEYPCYLIILDKKNDIQEKIPEHNNVTVFYKCSNLNVCAKIVANKPNQRKKRQGRPQLGRRHPTWQQSGSY